MSSMKACRPSHKTLFTVMFILAIVTPLVGGHILSASPFLSSDVGRYGSSGSAPFNAIINGNFETGDFTGWTTINNPAIIFGGGQVYDGARSAMNDHLYDGFYQNLNFSITYYSVFSFAVYAVISASDSEWHEIRLTITQSGLPTIYLHYRVQSTQPADTASDKYFLVGRNIGKWYATNRPVINDLVEKGVTQYFGGTITNISCQQGGMSGTVYDSLGLSEYDPLQGSASNAIVNGGFEFQNFTGWTLVGTPPYVTIIDYDRSQVFEGFFSAYNHHYYESFYQVVNVALTRITTFSAAMLATVSVSNIDSHEIILDVDEAGLATVSLHYTIQTSQPTDTATDKYFLIGSNLDQFYVLERNVWSDLLAKGLTPASDWSVIRVTCQQNGVCCTVYDSIRLQDRSSDSNAVPNGDFEDSRVFGYYGYAVPYGWTTENHGGIVYSRNTNIDAFKGSRCWEMSTAGNGWKNIWYYFDGAGAPDNLTFAVKIAQGQHDNDIIQVKIKDLTQTSSVSADVELMYEFSLGSLQVWPNNTYQKVIHEEVSYGVWYNETKQWKADWQSAYGSPANMGHYWALLLGINTYYVSDTMVARFDAVCMENSTHPQYWPSPETNFGFEDPRVHSGGAYSYPYGWTTQNNAGQVDSSNTNNDSYEGSRCWQMSSGSGSGWKNIWYYFDGAGIPDVCAFALKLVRGQNTANVIQVKIKDLTMTQSVSSDVELIYEFSLGSQQVWSNTMYRKNIHARIDAGVWYNETKQWKADWQSAYGSPANMSDCWALLLAVGTPYGSDQMIARFDAISLYNSTAPPPGFVLDPASILIAAGVGLITVLFFIGAVVVISRRRRAYVDADVHPIPNDKEDRTPAVRKLTPASPSFCPYCGSFLGGVHANYCPKCGGNLQTT